MKDVEKMADAMEWEKNMLIGRLERIKIVISRGAHNAHP
jgi:hypothetical protein